jgi:dihydrofolate synthase/folylpolyglutamate synthase
VTHPRLDYPAAVAELQGRGRYGISLGLQRITALLDELGRPDLRLRGALVGGTNGKGSVVALVLAVLRQLGLHVGSMPKPHLASYRERISIDGTSISRERFAAAISAVLPALDRVNARLGPPTEFEVLTAAAFAELARSDVDLVLVEVGLGGRLDATNALDPGVAAITNVQHDHQRQLGSTLAAIAAEKAAIIKRGNLAITGATGRGLAPILARCAATRAPLRRAGAGQPYHAVVLQSGWDGLLVHASTPDLELADLRIGLLGGHQATNAAVALALLDALSEDAARRGAAFSVTEAAIRTGFAGAAWPGRMELLRTRGLGPILLDGAHNPAGARALASALAELGLRRFPLVFGAMRGKQVSGALRALAPLEPRPIFTGIDDPRAHRPAALLRAWQRIDAGGRVADSPRSALATAAELRASADQPIVVAGSLYLVGAVRAILTGEEADQ